MSSLLLRLRIDNPSVHGYGPTHSTNLLSGKSWNVLQRSLFPFLSLHLITVSKSSGNVWRGLLRTAWSTVRLIVHELAVLPLKITRKQCSPRRAPVDYADCGSTSVTPLLMANGSASLS
jgi:hypothetical protein